MIKLGKALYYRHNNHAFDGAMYARHIDRFSKDTTPEFIAEILRWPPQPRRSRETASLCLNNSSTDSITAPSIALCTLFQLIAVGREMDVRLRTMNPGMDFSKAGRHECFL
jgi:hypothetical protein